MRILYFAQHFSTPAGSSGIRPYQMARAATAYGHSVTVVCGSYSGGNTGLATPFSKGVRRGTVDGIDVIEMELSYSNDDSFFKRTMTFVKYAFASARIALTERYDLLFATSTPLTSAFPGIVARWLRSKPFVFEVRDLWPELPRAMGVIRNRLVLGSMWVLEWVAYHSANRLVALSPGIAEGIRKRGIDETRIAMVPNGCDLDIFAKSSPPQRPEGIDDGDLMAIFAGTHGLANGLDSVIAAAAELKKRKKENIKFVLIGQGKMKNSLVESARNLQLDNVIFLDPVNKETLSGLFSVTDIGLQVLANVPAFYFGTSPNKFFDYIAASLPVLTNYPGWIANMVEDAGAGVSVPPSDPAAFADALVALENDRSSLAAMRKGASRLAKEQFDRSLLAERWVDWVTEGSVAKGASR